MTKSLSEKNTKTIPNELIDFNWAACLLTFVWGIRYKAWITFLSIPLFFIQLPLGLNWLLLAIFQIYCGFKGNEWAYRVDWWKKSKDFRITQMKWAALALTIYIVFPLLLLSIATKFLKNANNFPNLIKNTQCTLAKKYIPQDLENMYTISENTFSTTFETKQRNKLSKLHTVTIEKSNKTPCKLEEKNCKIRYEFYFDKNYSDMPNICEFYFSNNNKFISSQETKKALDKGINILKYLK